MSDLNQTVEFIVKQIEKLKSVTRFNRTLMDHQHMPSILGRGAIAAMVLQDYYPEN